MAPRLLWIPYVVGREAEDMGAGPLALVAPAAAALGSQDVRRISLTQPRTTEIAACFDLNRQLAREVAAARADGVLPVVLTGNCHSQQAVVAGLGADGLGLVWLDCHADFNTPETTETGYFDGQGLAMVVGDCWQKLCATVPGFVALGQDRVVLAGVRDMEAGERERLDSSAIRRVDVGDVEGLSDQLGHVRAVLRDRQLAALTLSAYDPAYDTDGRVRDAALAVLHAVAKAEGL